MEYFNLKSVMIEITDILTENKNLKNDIKVIIESNLKNDNFYLSVIKDLKNENKELNDLFLSQNRELKKMLNEGIND
tara:strand:+ start:35 stop:265 length:231 start_codon:yes stop_codon:yes gene_type:complete